MSSGLWLSPEYYYDKKDGWYEILPPTATPPSYMVTAPDVIQTAVGALVVGSQDYNVAKALGLLDPSTGFVQASPAGGAGGTTVSQTSSGADWFDMTSLVNVINSIQSAGASGNASATSNTQVGSAVTGAATVVANLINLLASAWSWTNGNLAFFIQNLFGNQNGNISLNPVSSPGGGGNASTSNNGSVDVNAQNSGNIVNNVNVGAQSGNANASDNTNAGNVSSGDAAAEVNIINLIDSMINSGQSFFGVLNIFGTLNGDVLFPNGFLNSVLGSQADPSATGPNSTNTSSDNNSLTANLTNNNVDTASNNITTTATSGGVSGSDNTQAGSLASGAANTSQGLFNLSNTSVFGDNAVLVIVNVLGHWIGKIMTLPGGTSESALLTGNATVAPNVSGPNSNNSSSQNNSLNVNANTNNVGSITNNVNVGAASGSASANDNMTVGNVTSGSADATSAVANLFNTVLNIKHWFGVLVINVFGNWFGDVADSAPVMPTAESNAAQVVAASAMNSLPQLVSTAVGSAPTSSTGNLAQLASTTTGSAQTHVLGDSTTKFTSDVAGQAQGLKTNVLFLISAAVLLLAGAAASVERRIRRHQKA